MKQERELENTIKKYVDKNPVDGNPIEIVKKHSHKAIPKKVTLLNEDYGYFECSNCDHAINYGEDYTEHNYCLNCGQRLDWTEVVE